MSHLEPSASIQLQEPGASLPELADAVLGRDDEHPIDLAAIQEQRGGGQRHHGLASPHRVGEEYGSPGVELQGELQSSLGLVVDQLLARSVRACGRARGRQRPRLSRRSARIPRRPAGLA